MNMNAPLPSLMTPALGPLEKLKYLMTYVHYTDQAAMAAMLGEMAVVLLHQVILRVGSCSYHISDIEYYLNTPQHKDEFIHGEKEQLQCGRWYYNRAGGVDLTFGNGINPGGILLRGLLRLDEPRGVVYGPQRVLRELLAVQEPVWAEPQGWRLEACESVQGHLWQTYRVGLKKKVSLEAEAFRLIPYRFIAHADYLKQLPSDEQNKLCRALSLTKADITAL